MKSFILCLSILISFNISLYAQWEAVAPKPIFEELTDIYMFNESSGIVGSREGTIIKTSNGFNTIQKIPTQWININRFIFFNNKTGVAQAGDNYDSDFLLKTTDGGLNWTSIFDIAPFKDFYFPDSLNGWVLTGDERKIYKTTDGGNSWTVLQGYNNGLISSMFLLDAKHGWVSTLSKLYKTTDGGISWDSVTISSGFWIKYLAFSNSTTGIMHYEEINYPFSMRFYRTTDGGTSWIPLPFNTIWGFNRLTYNDPRITLLYKNDYHVDISDDNGVSWNTVAVPLPHYSCRFFFLTNDTVFSAGDAGIIKRSNNHGNNWTDLGSLPGGNRYLNFTNDGWAYTAPFYKSTDDGNTWFHAEVPIPDHTSSFYYLNHLHGFFAAKNILYETTDGGLTFQVKMQFPTSERVDEVSFINDSIGLFRHGTYNDGTQDFVTDFYKTTNGGADWNALSLSDEWPFHMHFINDSIGFANHGWITLDGGTSWQVNNFAKANSYYFFDSKNGVAGLGNTFIKTYDSGLSYIPLCSMTWDITAVVFKDTLNGWAGGWGPLGKGVYRTTNGGTSWHIELQLPAICSVSDLKIHNNNLFALSSTSIIYKRTLQEVTTLETSSSALRTPSDFLLYQNYPNPFNPSTTIKFTLPDANLVSIKVYNALGQMVNDLTNKLFPAGDHKVIFNAGILPSGIYIYRIQAGTYSETRKMLLLR